jgi:hypothetical protein
MLAVSRSRARADLQGFKNLEGLGPEQFEQETCGEILCIQRKYLLLPSQLRLPDGFRWDWGTNN